MSEITSGPGWSYVGKPDPAKMAILVERIERFMAAQKEKARVAEEAGVSVETDDRAGCDPEPIGEDRVPPSPC